MSSSEPKSGIGTKLTLAVIAVLLVGVVTATAIVGAAATGVIGDTEPVGDNNITDATTTAVTDVAWVDATAYTSNNTTQATLYDENGNKIWVTNLQDKFPDNYSVERLQGENRSVVDMETYNTIATDGEFAYVAVNFDSDGGPDSIVYKLNQSTGSVVSETSRNTSTTNIRVDKSGDLRYDDPQRTYSLSKDTRYNLLDDGTIEVYDTSNTTGDGTLEKTIDASYDANISGTGSKNTVLESTDNYVVVWVQIGTDHDLHIVNRETGESEYEIEDVEGGDIRTRYDNTSRVVAAPDGEIKLEAYNTHSPSTHYFVRFDYTNGTVVENQSGEVESYINDDGEADTKSPVEVDFFRNGFAEDVEFVPLGELSLSVTDENGSTTNSDVTVKIFNDSGHQVFERSDINGTEIQSNYSIDAYAGDYSVRVEADGYDETVYSASIDEHTETVALDYSLQDATGTLKIDSVTSDSGTAVSNWSVEIYDSNDALVLSDSNLSAPYNTTLTANQTYTVEIVADGYNTTNDTVTITDDTTSTTSFTLTAQAGDGGDENTTTETPTDDGDSTDNTTTTDDGDSTDNTTTTDDSDDGGFIGGGGSGSGLTDTYAVVFGIGGIGFLIFLLLAVLAFREMRKQSFALILVMMVLVSGVGPMLFIDPVSAQTTDTPEYETADLLVFTANENKSQVAQETQDKVVALDPNTSEVAWETRLNGSTNANIVYSVAWDRSANRIYATSMEEDGSIHLYEIQDATGDVVGVHKLNITPERIGKDSVAQDSTLYFTTDGTSYKYDFESENLTATNSYTPSAQVYDIGFTGGDVAISTYGSDYITTYLGETEQYQTYTSRSIASIQHTEIGFLYQDSSNISLRNTSNGDVVWDDSTAQTLTLHGATSDGSNTIYARVGDDLYSYNRDSGNQSVLYDGSIPDNTTAQFAQMDYRNGRIHTYQTLGGSNLTNETPTHLYHIHDANTGELLYSEEIVYDSNKHQSVAIVYEQADTVEVIVGSGSSDYSPEDVLGELIGDQVMLIVAVLVGTLLGLLVILVVVKIVWNTVTAPLRILFWPFKMMWKAVKMVF